MDEVMIERILAGVVCFAIGFFIFYMIRALSERKKHTHRYTCRPTYYEEGYGAVCICDICGKEEVLT